MELHRYIQNTKLVGFWTQVTHYGTTTNEWTLVAIPVENIWRTLLLRKLAVYQFSQWVRSPHQESHPRQGLKIFSERQNNDEVTQVEMVQKKCSLRSWVKQQCRQVRTHVRGGLPSHGLVHSQGTENSSRSINSRQKHHDPSLLHLGLSLRGRWGRHVVWKILGKALHLDRRAHKNITLKREVFLLLPQAEVW